MWLLPWKMYFISVSLFWRSSSRTPRVCSETGRTKQKHHFLHHVVHYDQLSKLGKVEHYSFAYISLEYLFMFFWPSSPLLLLTSEFCQLMLYHFCCLRTLGVSELIFFSELNSFLEVWAQVSLALWRHALFFADVVLFLSHFFCFAAFIIVVVQFLFCLCVLSYCFLPKEWHEFLDSSFSRIILVVDQGILWVDKTYPVPWAGSGVCCRIAAPGLSRHLGLSSFSLPLPGSGPHSLGCTEQRPGFPLG